MALAGDPAQVVVHRIWITLPQIGRHVNPQRAKITGDGGANVGMSSRRAMSCRALVGFLLERIIAIFSLRVIVLVAASRFKAELWVGCVSCQTNLIGRRLRVYRDAP